MLMAGTPAPAFELPLLGGAVQTLETLTTSGPVVLAFFKVSCPVCQLTFPFLDRLARAGSLPVVGVSQDNARNTEGFNRAFGVTFPVLLDAAGYPASNAFGITHVPSMFVVEPGAAISWASSGFDKKALEELAARAGVALFQPHEAVPLLRPG